ncbi:DUF3761 domain-containing protein [Streptomyces sp. NBC_01288]|uniref:DUF3761 domain-containing protein n=1 Tax=Streptomyces sp. NBC_01288 TaxID=2903814 RepID=UPI002E15B669|nr:DUF3761 domain-containing protein [Streptomyces sp. NBC_01288]
MAATCARHTTGVCKANSPHPCGATAKCRDGSYSYSAHARGTCSHHRGASSTGTCRRQTTPPPGDTPRNGCGGSRLEGKRGIESAALRRAVTTVRPIPSCIPLICSPGTDCLSRRYNARNFTCLSTGTAEKGCSKWVWNSLGPVSSTRRPSGPVTASIA